MGRPQAFTHKQDYISVTPDGLINFAKSPIFAPVDDNILEMLSVLGHLGCPSLDHLLLRLKVVGSKPLFFASPEQDILCSVAKHSMAFHMSSCVIFFSLLKFTILDS